MMQQFARINPRTSIKESKSKKKKRSKEKTKMLEA